VRVAEFEVLSPAVPRPDVLVAFNQPSLDKFGPEVVDGGVVIYDSSVAPQTPVLPGRRVVPIAATEIANRLGRLTVKNIVALGALAAATDLFPEQTFVTAVREALHARPALLALNEQAFAAGVAAVRADGGGLDAARPAETRIR
jgi:Pyruvate/2-oxoacid:ferredoxin oxidoreductase gamma subunit